MTTSELAVFLLQVVFVASPLLLGLSYLENQLISLFSSNFEKETINLAIINGLLLVAGLLYWEIQKTRDVRLFNQELAKNIKTTVQDIKSKQN